MFSQVRDDIKYVASEVVSTSILLSHMFIFKAIVSILAIATIAVEAGPPRPEVDRFRALKHKTPEVYTTCKKKGHAALTIVCHS